MIAGLEDRLRGYFHHFGVRGYFLANSVGRPRPGGLGPRDRSRLHRGTGFAFAETSTGLWKTYAESSIGRVT